MEIANLGGRVVMKTYKCPIYECEFESDDYSEVSKHMDKEHKSKYDNFAWRSFKEGSIMNQRTRTLGIKD